MEQEKKSVSEDTIKRLMGAKKVMDKVESGDFKGGNVNSGSLEQDFNSAVPGHELPTEQASLTESLPDSGKKSGPHYSEYDQDMLKERVENSGFPDEVKQAMIEEPIERIDPMSEKTFSLEDVERVVGKQGNSQKTQQQQPVNENGGGSNKQMINEAEIKNIVNKELMDSMHSIKKYIKEELKDEFNEVIKEEVKKTIRSLVKKKNAKKSTTASK